MNDQPLTEILLWDLYRQFFELLIPGLLIAIAVLVVATLVLIFGLCREATRADRKKSGTDERVPLEAGAPVVPLHVEQPTWSAEPARFIPDLEVAAYGR